MEQDRAWQGSASAAGGHTPTVHPGRIDMPMVGLDHSSVKSPYSSSAIHNCAKVGRVRVNRDKSGCGPVGRSDIIGACETSTGSSTERAPAARTGEPPAPGSRSAAIGGRRPDRVRSLPRPFAGRASFISAVPRLSRASVRPLSGVRSARERPSPRPARSPGSARASPRRRVVWPSSRRRAKRLQTRASPRMPTPGKEEPVDFISSDDKDTAWSLA
ncbi:hypothetical protein GCM10009639_31530 [Kitasatospora putterlickiae]|uniref:Uncharacterized protein n=1 Tax=Kitasatospora putterlickiae TaxID=221725 RepID=A0ABP4IT38_9ACTN